MSNIRVTYSGLISFVVGIISIFTGLIFTLIVTRNIDPLEFGTWNILKNIFVYVVIFEPIAGYWVTREIARDIRSGYTAIITSGIISCLGIVFFLAISFLVGENTDANKNILFMGAILIPIIFINRTLTAINLGSKPHAITYGLLAYGIIQIPSILVFLNYLNLGVLGIILASLCAYISSIFVLAYFGKNQLKDKFNPKFIKKWIKLSWLPIFSGLYTIISSIDVTIFALLTNSVIGLAFWGAALVVPIIITQSAYISKAIYPKILGNDDTTYLKDNFSLLLYFAIPLTAMSISFAKPSLYALNPEYVIAVPVLLFSSLSVFFNNLNITFFTSLLGTEKIDIDEKSNFKNYLHSKLFSLPAIMLMKYGLYVVTLFFILFLLIPKNYSQIELVVIWSIIPVFVYAPFTIYFYYLMRKTLNFSFDFFRILKFILASIFSFGISLLLLENYLIYNSSLFIFLGNLLPFVLFSVVTYLLITYISDSKTRHLLKSIVNELKSR